MISQEEVLAVTENIFTTMVGSDIHVVDNFEITDQEPITGCVHISGVWSGAVLVQMTGQLANEAAGKLLAIEESEVGLEDRQDTMAELANMIGGNIKSLVPGPSVLSLPTVTTGKEFDIRIFGTVVESSVPMECNGQQLRVVICRGEG